MNSTAASLHPPGTTAHSTEGDRRTRVAWYLAAFVVAVVFVGYCVVNVATMLRSDLRPGQGPIAVVCVAVLLGIQLLYFSRPTIRLRSTPSHVILLLQACLAYLPLLLFGQAWLGMPSFLAGSVLLVLRPRVAWPVLGAIVVSIAWIQADLGGEPLNVVYSPVSTLVFGLEVYLLTRLARLVVELHSARTELARMAVAEERLRFARDLNDLLGVNLSAIVLKGELVRRIVPVSPEKAKAELAEIAGIAQRTLADVRSVASDYRELSLEGESRTAQALLAASDIDVRIHLDHGDLPAQIRPVLAVVLREGVAAVLRHNAVERCEIAVRQTASTVTLDIVHDGMPDDTGTTSKELTRLSEQAASLGGSAEVSAEPDGRRRLHVDLPLHGKRPADGPLTGARAARQREQVDGRMTKYLLTAVYSGLFLSAVIHLLYLAQDFWQLTVGIGNMAALLALQLSYFTWAGSRLQGIQRYGLLFVQACLTFLPLLQLHGNWVSLPGLLAGTALLILRPAPGSVVFVATVGAVAWVQVGYGAPTNDVAFNIVATTISGVVVFGLVWLTSLVAELDVTRTRLAQMAVSEERLRFARDLHDLLGLSLSAIALKSELTDRLLAVAPDRAAAELDDVLGLARQALSDVRSVAGGYREMSLDKESRSAESVLRAADVQVRVEMEHGDLPAQVKTILAVVLREGVTNVLRHSKVQQCEIAVRQSGDIVYLDLVNDGANQGDEEKKSFGGAKSSGITNLSDRVNALGGQLTAGPEPDGHFRLRVALPV
jgi:signal transduction histidine kinase